MTFSPSLSPLEKVRSVARNVINDHGRDFMCSCPAHGDDHPSLHVTEGDGGAVLLKCHAQDCRPEDIMAAWGLVMVDLFPHADPPPAQRKTIEKVYDYFDAKGNLLFQVVRFRPKAFTQRRPVPNDNRHHIWAVTEGWYEEDPKTGDYRKAQGASQDRNNRPKPSAVWYDAVETVPYRLPEVLAQVSKKLNVLIAEGEKDVDNLQRLGFVATCNPMGAGKWRVHHSEYLRGANVVIIADKDDAGRKHAQQVARSLWGKASKIRVMELPDRQKPDGEPIKVKDASDWIEAGGTADELVTLVKALPVWELSAKAGPNALPMDAKGLAAGNVPKPAINASSQDLPAVTASAWEALQLYNGSSPSVFRRGGDPVRIEHSDKGTPVIKPLTPDRMRYVLARCIDWYRLKDGNQIPSKPPPDIIHDVLATPDYPLPVLDRIVEVPVFSPQGEVCTTPGYHADAQVYYEPASALSIPGVSVAPGEKEVSEARRLLLEELLGDFPFVDQSDKANAAALFLVPFVRSMINGPTPLHLVEAPTMGSGKGLLVKALLYPALGRAAEETTTEAGDDDEWNKCITTALKEGKPLFCIDNIVRGLTSGALASALTATTWSKRLLGENASINAPVSHVWAATGNNPTLSTEIARRSIRIRIDPKQDRPWFREGFRHPELMVWVAENRASLVWAGLTLVRVWIAAGKPKAEGARVLGSYEIWSTVLGGILKNAGIEGFLDNLLEFYEASDHEGSRWRAFVETWWTEFQERKVAVADLFPLVVETGDFDFGRGDERAQKTSFGRQLMRQRDRVIGERRIVEAGKQQRARMWQLLPAGLSGPGVRAEQNGMFGQAGAEKQGNQGNQSNVNPNGVADKEAAATDSKKGDAADDDREPF
jgi:5S rRNA maturation endonuclease (ribonuclease M5)